MRIIILAAGRGTRMNHELPKPLVPLKEKPLINYVLEAVHASGVDTDPVIVVAPDNKEEIKEAVGEEYEFAIQEKTEGTGDAVRAARENLEGQSEHVLVLYADQPLISASMIQNMAEKTREESAPITMATVTVPDFKGWRSKFMDFGRIVRDGNGEVTKIVEKKDATEEELAIKELNPAYMGFKANWLWNHIDQLTNDNAKGEYYLTELIQLAEREGGRIATVSIEPEEALGCNTQEQVARCEEIVEERNE